MRARLQRDLYQGSLLKSRRIALPVGGYLSLELVFVESNRLCAYSESARDLLHRLAFGKQLEYFALTAVNAALVPGSAISAR